MAARAGALKEPPYIATAEQQAILGELSKAALIDLVSVLWANMAYATPSTNLFALTTLRGVCREVLVKRGDRVPSALREVAR